ncbi:uncharacterized protein LOC143123937 [Alosa pseudoharengus]|uniref:uncharacterized protein LOC143123937 n=1 Tax=Alosa pseudoharengus TaxID=34774 RepID=UPI003F890984
MEGIYNQSLEYFNFTDLGYLHSRMIVVQWAISCVAFPIICAAIYRLFCLIKSDHIAPVYVINLLISDMLQICTKPIWNMISMLNVMHLVLFSVYSLGLMASICFMLFISAERYVMIAYPIIAADTQRKCHFGYILIISLTIYSGNVDHGILTSNVIAFYLLPYPLVVCFSMRTRRALSNSKSVPAHEQRKILGTLALVIFSYTVFYLPYIILMLTLTISPALLNETHMQNFGFLVDILLSLSPLADAILYVFMRRDAKDILGALACCVKKEKAQSETLQTS